ncbi:rhomboid family intramembrane serine protease [Pseudomonas sp. SLFW]|uniref:rhomboid family intramembrane serine protease n=1 Tax=Pseudomonas sp. SLFW TaxID=2683259 RepID=UPI0014134DD6|nr:rhomboid family intramembrane serine protease [Pseudomonas sp. SLFW]NBB11219.1 rhomboid family intramembrane serine protease [Pseudomonas sp. SLFW]
MERTEPITAPLDQAANAAYNGHSFSTSTTKVRFAVQPKRGKRGVTRLSTQTNGRLDFTFDAVELSKSKRRLFRRPVETKWTFARSQIFDARITGVEVFFDVHTPEGIQQVIVIPAKRGLARTIFEQLPTRMTPARAEEQAALDQHAERIKTLTPITWVTYALIAINLLVYLAMCAGGVGVMAENVALTVGWGTNYGPQTLSGEWWRLLSSVFVHFGLFHFAFNMVSLYLMGRLAERLYGSARFLALYLFAGLTGSLVSVLWHPINNSAGASGAIFGVFGALLVFLLKYRRELPTSIAVQQRTSILVLIGYNLFSGFTHHGIDNGAHLGGLAGGMLIGFTLARSLNEPARSKTALRSLIVSGVLALTVLGASLYVLTEIREAIGVELARQKQSATPTPGLPAPDA